MSILSGSGFAGEIVRATVALVAGESAGFDATLTGGFEPAEVGTTLDAVTELEDAPAFDADAAGSLTVWEGLSAALRAGSWPSL